MNEVLQYASFRVGYFLRGFRWNVLCTKWPFSIYYNHKLDHMLGE